MPRKPQPPSKLPRFFPAGEDHDLLDDVDDDAPTPIIEFGRRQKKADQKKRRRSVGKPSRRRA